MERLDKLISRELHLTRSEAKALIKSGAVAVNGAVALSPEQKCGDGDSVTANGKSVTAQPFVYIMMNKPAGVISASDGKGEKTVLDLLPEELRRKGLFPAGRLDKDTTGFVLITDDGAFAHRILSPRSHVDKTYIARLDKPFDDGVIQDFANGMTLGEERLLPAVLEEGNADRTVARLTIRQGMYHQVKRMFKKHGITVTALHRLAIGGVMLDKNLKEGESRYLTSEELSRLA